MKGLISIKNYFTGVNSMVNKVFKNNKISTVFNVIIHALFAGYMTLSLFGFPVISSICLILLMSTYLPVVYKANKLSKINEAR